MDGVKMNGKVLKVVEYNLTFGGQDRFVNVYSLFKYKKNNNLYIIYSDPNPSYSYLSYGSSHIKNDTVLSMATSNKADEEIIKEYIFKVTNQESLENFEVLSLQKISGIEIINSNKLELKTEVLTKLINFCLPKVEKAEESTSTTASPKKKKGTKKVFFLLFLLLLLGGSYYYFTHPAKKQERVIKNFTCQKSYNDNSISATVEEENTYYFNQSENLEYFIEKKNYQFASQVSYQDFINKGLIYKYLPEDEENSTLKKDDQNYSFETTLKQNITSSYNKPTAYEESLTYMEDEGYSCKERLETENE